MMNSRKHFTFVVTLFVAGFMLSCDQQKTMTVPSAPAGANANSSTASDAEAALQRSRAVEAVIWGMSAVNYDLMRQTMLSVTAAKENEIVFWSQPADEKNQTLTPNPDSIYFMSVLEHQAGWADGDRDSSRGHRLHREETSSISGKCRWKMKVRTARTRARAASI